MRDTILVIAPSAGGKTEVLNILRAHPWLTHIPHVFKPLSDSHTIVTRMYEDDLQNHGRGHYHAWSTKEERWNGHTHRNYTVDPDKPFTLTGNDVAHNFVLDFFEGLRQLPKTGELRFAELSGGVNTNDFSEPASKTDLSFGTYARMLRRGQFPKEGLSRVIAVIHTETDNDVRERLNKGRMIPSPEEIENGTGSWPLGPEAMKIFGEDDFYELEPLLQEMEIPHIYTIPNDGGILLREGVEYHIPKIQQSWEGATGRRKEIR